MADPLATPGDVDARWPGHTLTADETAVAILWLAEVSARIRQRFPTVDARIADGTLDRSIVVGAAVRPVLRVLQNTKPGVTSWTVDDYTERMAEVRAGLWLEPDDIEALTPPPPKGASTGAFTIRPAGAATRCRSYW